MKLKHLTPKYSNFRLLKISNIKIFIILFIIIFFVLYSLGLVYFGAKLQRDQTTANIQTIIYNIINSKFKTISNYFLSLNSDITKLYLDINFKGLSNLDAARDRALARGYINRIDQKKYTANGLLINNDEHFDVVVSPTGFNLDLIGDLNKRAFKLKVKDDGKLFGMNEFKLLPPKARHFITEWIIHQMMNNEGLIALRYFFVNLYINNENKGIYAFEEHYNKELLENNGRKEGIIFRFDGKNIYAFNKNKLRKSKLNINRLNLLRVAWQSVNKKEILLKRLFDFDKFAKLFAIIDITYGYHSLGANLTYYFNPITNLVEPIPREYNSLRYEDGPPSSNLPILIKKYFSLNSGNSNEYTNNEELHFNPEILLFSDIEFQKLYLKYLNKYANKKYLDDFFISIDKQFKKFLSQIYQEYPYYQFPKEFLYQRQDDIKTMLTKDLNIHASFNLRELKIINNSYFPIELLNISLQEKEIFNLGKLILQVNNKIIKNGNFIKKELDKYDSFLNYRVPYSHNWNKINLVYKNNSKVLLPKLRNISSTISDYKSELNVNHVNKTIRLKFNTLTIDKDLYLPQDFILFVYHGQKIYLKNNASIFSKGILKFIGKQSDRILIKAIDSSTSGVFINRSKDENQFRYVTFDSLDSPHKFVSGITGSITSFFSAVIFENCIFKNNYSEDYVNFIQSNFIVKNSKFLNIYGDSIDSDYSTGRIDNSTFLKLSNDALDFSGSDISMNNIKITSAKDKALSVGENSKVHGSNISILNSEIGIASKDSSSVNLSNVNLSNNEVAITVFEKKAEYGPSSLNLQNFILDNNSVNYLIEKNSSLILDSKIINGNLESVEKLLYGNQFGKKSIKL